MITSAVFLALAFRGLHPDQFWSSLGKLNPPWLMAAVLVYFAAVLGIALRWQILLHSVKRVRLGALFKLVAIGYKACPLLTDESCHRPVFTSTLPVE